MANNTIYITGHKNPDSDSICASIALAYLKRQLGYDAIPCRLGKVNLESQFILNKFGMEEPELITSAKAVLKEIHMDPAVQVHPEATLRHVWDMCLKYNTKTIYVVDADDNLIGLTTMSDISKIQMQDLNITANLLKATPLDNLVAVLKGKYILKGNMPRTGFVRIFDKKMMSRDLNGTIMALSDNEDSMLKCMSKGCAVICIAENYIPSDFVIRMAREMGVTLISTNYNIMKILQMIYRGIPVGLMMTPIDKLDCFDAAEYVEDTARTMLKTRYRSYPVVSNRKILGSVTRYHLLSYKKRDFILVDHNERSQTIDDLEYANILEIVDHHRIGDIETNQPITFRNQRLGSTCTIIIQMFHENRIEIPYEIAGLLVCAMISDTMNFTSPTCTDIDIHLANELAKQHGFDLAKLAEEMFRETATIEGKSYKEILYTDYKTYELEGHVVAIGQTNVFDLSTVDEIAEGFQTYLEEENDRFKNDVLMMAFTSVEGKRSRFMMTGKLSESIVDMFESDHSHGYYGNYVSRKKQIVPKISSLLK